MNTTSVRIENRFKPLDSSLYSLKMLLTRMFSRPKQGPIITSGQPTALPYLKNSAENFPTVSGIHGISYGENERDRLFYG